MFGFKKKEELPEKTMDVDGIFTLSGQADNQIIPLGSTDLTATETFVQDGALIAPEKAVAVKSKHGKLKINDKAETKVKDTDFTAFYELARILNVSVEKVKDECCMFQINKIMSRLGKVIVRFNVSDSELEKIVLNSNLLKINETIISPAYISPLVKKFKASKVESLNVCALIDFPFGDGLFKSKITNVKDAIRMGVDGISVMMPLLLLEKDRQKQLKKQIKKIGKLKKGNSGIAFSVMEMTEDDIKTVMKFTEKSKCKHVTFVFGEANEQEVKQKFKVIEKHKSKKITTKIMGNVEHVEAVVELFKMGVQTILTPFADDIGKELVKRFGIKCIKLK